MYVTYLLSKRQICPFPRHESIEEEERYSVIILDMGTKGIWTVKFTACPL